MLHEAYLSGEPPAFRHPPFAAGAAEGDRVAATGREILIVEDNQVNAMILATMLRKGGWTPITASDGLEGIAMSARLRPGLVLMDLQMPRLDGYAAAREILRSSAEAGVAKPPVIIAVTAAPGPGARESCAAAGFADLLAKPVDMSELLALVTRHLGPA